MQRSLGTLMLVPVVAVFLVFGYLTNRSSRIAIDQAHTTFPIIAFELAASGKQAETILDDVTSELTGSGVPTEVARDTVEAAVRRSLWWDFGFIVGYSLLILVLGRLVAERWNGRVARLARIVAWSGPAAGLLDVIENVGLLQVLADTTRTGWAVLAAAVSWAKWVLVLGAALFLVGALISGGVNGVAGRPRRAQA